MAPTSCRGWPGFNPRPRAAGDWNTYECLSLGPCFNPRPRAAGDLRAARCRPRRTRFNPRPRAAGDQCRLATSVSRFGFNPRPRAAGDGEPLGWRGGGEVSIHARARRATVAGPRTKLASSAFQSTPARGGRRQLSPRVPRALPFQSTPARGGRHVLRRQHSPSCSFNPRPRAAGDHGACPHAAWRLVSIHARARRATARCF